MSNIVTLCVFVFISRHTKGIFLYRIVLDNVSSVNFLVNGTSVKKKKSAVECEFCFSLHICLTFFHLEENLLKSSSTTPKICVRFYTSLNFLHRF
jgi:hypothetical protein